MSRKLNSLLLAMLVLTAAMGLKTIAAAQSHAPVMVANAGGPTPPTPWKNAGGPTPPTPWKNAGGPTPPTPWK